MICKKNLKSYKALIIIFMVTLVSCSSSSSIENDAKEIAHARCDLYKFVNKFENPPESGTAEDEEYKRLEHKLEVLIESFQKRHGNPDEDEALRKKINAATEEIVSKCGFSN